jgi:hypothetical protein
MKFVPSFEPVLKYVSKFCLPFFVGGFDDPDTSASAAKAVHHLVLVHAKVPVHAAAVHAAGLFLGPISSVSFRRM